MNTPPRRVEACTIRSHTPAVRSSLSRDEPIAAKPKAFAVISLLRRRHVFGAAPLHDVTGIK